MKLLLSIVVWNVLALILADFGFADTQIDFDLRRPSGFASGKGSGILHTMTGSEPSDSFVKPLKLKFWRGACFLDDRLYARLQNSGATIQYVLSDGFQHPAVDGDCRRQIEVKDRWPDKSPDLWTEHVLSEVRRIRAKGWKVIWEPWNEPDYWDDASSDSFEHYLEAFLTAYNLIRSVDPKARISGPSLSADASIGWDASFEKIERFLRFCQ
jgi:hypothetical protein